MKVLEVILKAMAREIKWIQAAEKCRYDLYRGRGRIGQVNWIWPKETEPRRLDGWDIIFRA